MPHMKVTKSAAFSAPFLVVFDFKLNANCLFIAVSERKFISMNENQPDQFMCFTNDFQETF